MRVCVFVRILAEYKVLYYFPVSQGFFFRLPSHTTCRPLHYLVPCHSITTVIIGTGTTRYIILIESYRTMVVETGLFRREL